MFNHGILKKIRYVADLSQKDLAEAIGVTQGTISQMESGIIPITSDKENQLIKAFTDSGLLKSHIALLASVLEASNL